MKIPLRDKFFAVNLRSSSSTNMRSALGAIAPKRDFVMCGCSHSYLIKLIDHKRIFRNFTRMLGRNAECYLDVALSKLSYRHSKWIVTQSPKLASTTKAAPT
jgi:hypothetical protein